MSEPMPGKLTAVLHLGAITKSSTGPTRIVGQQCYMEGLSGVIYVTPEIAAQWIHVLNTITEESK